MADFRKIAPESLEGNPFQMIGRDWMLVTATDESGEANTMTASWGGVGILWNEPVAFVFVRPQRHTHNFTESGDIMTLSFFGGEERKALSYCGRVSGRDEDKFAGSGLTKLTLGENGAVGFEEAKVILVCRKLYADVLKKDSFYDAAALGNYPDRDFHTVYVVKIEEVLVQD